MYGPCSKFDDCQEDFADERYSLGIYAGRWCDRHWASSGYRQEGPSGFDPADAGESYEEI
jgi:hypothetical protein